METGTLEKKIKLLSIDQKHRLEDLVDAMLNDSNIHIAEKNILVEPENKEKTESFEIKAGFGGGKGIFGYIADDFDAPLDDFKDYM